LDPACTNDGGYAHEEILEAVLTIELSRCRQKTLFVVQEGFCHADRRCRRGVISASAHQLHNLATAGAGARHDAVERRLIDELSNGHTGSGAIRKNRNHVIAVAAEHHRAHVLHTATSCARQEQSEASAIEYA